MLHTRGHTHNRLKADTSLPPNPPIPPSLPSAEQRFLFLSCCSGNCLPMRKPMDRLLSCSKPQRAYNNSFIFQALYSLQKHSIPPAQSLPWPRQTEIATGCWTDKSRAPRGKTFHLGQHSTKGTSYLSIGLFNPESRCFTPSQPFIHLFSPSQAMSQGTSCRPLGPVKVLRCRIGSL